MIDVPQPPQIDFLDAGSTQLIKSTVPNQSPTSLPNIVQSSDQFWTQKGLMTAYQKGLFFGRGDMSNIYMSEFIKKFRKLLEDIVREELKDKNQTFEVIKEEFKAFEFICNILLKHLNTHGIELKNEKNLAILHGFITAYVDSTNQTT
jgi:hypothetical protein